MNEDLNCNLQKAEEEVAVLHELADYMVQKKFPKAKEHTDKVIALETEIMEWWALLLTGLLQFKMEEVTWNSCWRSDHLEEKKSKANMQLQICTYAAWVFNRAICWTALTMDSVFSLTAAFRPTYQLWGAGLTCLTVLTGIFEKKHPLLHEATNWTGQTCFRWGGKVGS